MSKKFPLLNDKKIQSIFGTASKGNLSRGEKALIRSICDMVQNFQNNGLGIRLMSLNASTEQSFSFANMPFPAQISFTGRLNIFDSEFLIGVMSERDGQKSNLLFISDRCVKHASLIKFDASFWDLKDDPQDSFYDFQEFVLKKYGYLQQIHDCDVNKVAQSHPTNFVRRAHKPQPTALPTT